MQRLHVLISSGPTREPLDPVRFVSNYSTGYMGALLAAEALRRGHRVTVVTGPAQEPLPKAATRIAVETARQMQAALTRAAPRADAIIMAAAVCDFQARRIAPAKLRRQGSLTVALKPTPDIVRSLPVRAGQARIGFAVETQRVLSAARRKLGQKRLDVVLAQKAQRGGSPFGRRCVQAWLLEKGKPATALGWISKSGVARLLLDKVERLWYGQAALHPAVREQGTNVRGKLNGGRRGTAPVKGRGVLRKAAGLFCAVY